MGSALFLLEITMNYDITKMSLRDLHYPGRNVRDKLKTLEANIRKNAKFTGMENAGWLLLLASIGLVLGSVSGWLWGAILAMALCWIWAGRRLAKHSQELIDLDYKLIYLLSDKNKHYITELYLEVSKAQSMKNTNQSMGS